MIGYAFERGLQFGWEGGGGIGILRGNVGGSYRPGADNTTRLEAVHYGVVEPWLAVGATLGIGVSSETDVGAALGVWEGGWVTPKDGKLLGYKCYHKGERVSVKEGDDYFTISAALGVRYLVDVWEFYFTPKFGWAKCFEFGS